MIDLSTAAIPFPPPDRPLWQRAGALALVVMLHIGLFQLVRSGLQQQAMPSIPKEIFVRLITPTPPAPPAAAPMPTPAEPPPQAAPKQTVMPTPKAMHKPAPKREHRPVHQAKPPPAPAPVEAAPPRTPPAPAPQPAPTPAPTPAPATPPATAPTPVPTTPPIPKTVSSGVECPHLPQPDYPMLSKRMGEEGQVMLRILVNERGRIEHAEIARSSGFSRLDEAARQAVMHAVCKPYLDNGKPVPVYAIQPIRFQLAS